MYAENNMRIITLLLTIILTSGLAGAQTKKTPAKKPAAQKTVTQKKKTTTKKQAGKRHATKNNASAGNSSINGLRNQSAKIKKEIRQQIGRAHV